MHGAGSGINAAALGAGRLGCHNMKEVELVRVPSQQADSVSTNPGLLEYR